MLHPNLFAILGVSGSSKNYKEMEKNEPEVLSLMVNTSFKKGAMYRMSYKINYRSLVRAFINFTLLS